MSNHIASLYSCLKDYTTPETVEGYACERCKKKDTSMKRTIIWEQPEVLVIQFKRFVYDLYGDRQAVKDKVSFPLENMSLDFFTHGNSNGTRGVYKLYGIVNHFGSLEGGHYISFIYNEPIKQWLQYNDSTVTRVEEKEMEDFAKGSSQPYLLFYKRV